MGNLNCGSACNCAGEEKKEAALRPPPMPTEFQTGDMHLESFKMMQVMKDHPNLDKYQKKVKKNTSNIDNISKILKQSNVIAYNVQQPIADQMSMPILNQYNPLRERILTFKPDTANNGGYYVL